MQLGNQNRLQISQIPIYWAGLLFLCGYWYFGFDGITFSDDVYYILAGKSFWEGSMQVDEYHFSSRWGAYVPFGFFGHLFGFHPKLISLFSLLCYALTYSLLLRYFQSNWQKILFTLWFCSQVYFLHFISKVYPDSALVLWVTLVPIASLYRSQRPIFAAFALILALFLGFITKETIVFLAPFPLLLLLADLRNKQVKWSFYLAILGFGLAFGGLYLGYFWYQFGDPLYRIQSINAGHYISEFTYADKGWTAILKRLTILPFSTFVERGYWPWIVGAIPALFFGLSQRKKILHEFTLALLCLLLGFWFMTSTLDFYNPIYLNPRHLIILVPTLAFCLTFALPLWMGSAKWKAYMTGLLIGGALIALIQLDWKMAAFNAAFIPLLFLKKKKIQVLLLAGILLVPALAAVPYQFRLKKYETLISTLGKLTLDTANQSIILTNNFLVFSKEVLLPNQPKQQQLLFPIENTIQLQRFPPEEIRVLIYEYYAHAYPKEQVDVERLELWIKVNGYKVIDEYRENQLWYRKLSRRPD